MKGSTNNHIHICHPTTAHVGISAVNNAPETPPKVPDIHLHVPDWPTSPFYHSQISIPCKSCGRETKKTIGWIKDHTEFTCACGTVIRLDTSQFKADITKVDRALSDFERSLKKLKEQ